MSSVIAVPQNDATGGLRRSARNLDEAGAARRAERRRIAILAVGSAGVCGLASLLLWPAVPAALQPLVAPVAFLAGAGLAFRRPDAPAPVEQPTAPIASNEVFAPEPLPIDLDPEVSQVHEIMVHPGNEASARVAAELRDFPLFTDIIRRQLATVTDISEEAAGKILSGLMAVDGQIEALMGFIHQSGSNDQVAEVVRDIESQIGACRDLLGEFVVYQTHEAGQAVQQRVRLQAETQSVSSALDGIGAIARQTSMLSINVAIQAARAGDVGKGFMVIGAEIRTLAQEVQTLSQEIHARIETLMRTIMVDFQERGERRGEMERTSIANIVETLDSLAENVTTLLTHQRDVLQKVETENEAIARPILDMMGSVQFQDITRQQIEQIATMSSTVEGHMEQLAVGLSDPVHLENLEPISQKLDALFASYVMDSQRNTHRAAQGDGAPAVPATVAIELF